MAARKPKVYVEHLRHGSGQVIERFESDSGNCLVIQYAGARHAFLIDAPCWVDEAAARRAFDGAKVRACRTDSEKRKSKVVEPDEEAEPPSDDEPIELGIVLPVVEEVPPVDEAELDLPDEEVEQSLA